MRYIPYDACLHRNDRFRPAHPLLGEVGINLRPAIWSLGLCSQLRNPFLWQKCPRRYPRPQNFHLLRTNNRSPKMKGASSIRAGLRLNGLSHEILDIGPKPDWPATVLMRIMRHLWCALVSRSNECSIFPAIVHGTRWTKQLVTLFPLSQGPSLCSTNRSCLSLCTLESGHSLWQKEAPRY